MFTSSARPRFAGRRSAKSREERVAATKAATVIIDGYDLRRDCTIRDINKGGARVSFINASGIPDTVLMICRSENLYAHCRVTWRRGNEVGLQFLQRVQEHNLEPLRQKQTKLYTEALARSRQRAVCWPPDPNQDKAEAVLFRKSCMLLGLDPLKPQSDDNIRVAFRERAKLAHPDRGGDLEVFQALNTACSNLLARIPQDAVGAQ